MSFFVGCDDSTANECTITCAANDCLGKTISCPVAGCNIHCTEKNSCVQSVVQYAGQVTNNATMSVACTAEYACDEMKVYGADVYKLEYTATKKSVDVTVFGTNSNEVTINCENSDSCYESTFNAADAKQFTLNAKGGRSFYRSEIFPARAGKVTINCASDCCSGACYDGSYYVPFNPIINCYGWGCVNFGDLYAYDTINVFSGATMNINGCNQCDSAGDCADFLYMKCGARPNYYDSETYNGDSCTSYDDDCGCNALVRNTNFKNDNSNSMCYGDTSSKLSIGENIGITVGITLAAVCCVFICLPLFIISLSRKATADPKAREPQTGILAVLFLPKSVRQPQETETTQT